MACMEHECENCGCAVFNNARDGGKCPKCGGSYWYSTFDEENDHDRDEDEKDEEEEE